MNAFPGWLKAVLAVVVLALLAGGVSFYRIQERRMRQDIESNLQAVTELKATQIADWRAGQVGEGGELTSSPFFARGVVQWLADPQTNTNTIADILNRFRGLREHYHYLDILLADTNGQVRLGLNGQTNSLSATEAQAASAVLRDGKPVLTDLHTDNVDREPYIGVVSPLFAGEGEAQWPVGTVIYKLGVRQFLYPLISSWPVPSQTAETLLVRRDGNDVLFLNDLRYQQDTALKLRIPLSQTNVPAVMAVLGKEGIVQGLDYRGVQVLAVLKHIPDSPWFIVAKMDQAEAFADWQFHAGLILSLLLALVAAAGAIMFVLWQRNQKAHYRALYQAESARLGSEKRYGITLKSIGDAVITTDAKGLVELLNPVAEMLTGWQQEDARGKPLDKIFRIINEDTRQPVESPVARIIREGMVAGLANHTVLVAKDGAARPIADAGAPIRDEQNNVLGVVLVFREQTEERKLQQTLRESERKYRELVQNANSIILRWNADGRVTFMNEFGQTFFGYTEPEILGKHVVGTIVPETESTGRPLRPFVAQILADPEAFASNVNENVCRDGRRVWISWYNRAVFDARGKLTEVFSVGNDVTERKRAEEEVRRHTTELAALNALTRGVTSSLSLEAVVASALREMVNAIKTDVAFLFQREGERLVLGGIAPESGRERFGQIPEHRVGECMCGLAVRLGQPLYSRDIFSDLRCTWEECKKAGFRSFAAIPLRAGGEIIGVIGLASGTERDFEQQAGFLETLANAVSVGLQNARLFADTKQAEKALSESETRYHALFDESADGILITDAETKAFKYANPALCLMLGYSEEELRTPGLTDIQRKDDVQSILAEFEAQTRSDKSLATDIPCLRKDGSVFYADINLTKITIDGRPCNVGFFRDITDRKQTEEALRRSREEFKSLFDNAPVGFHELDTDGRIVRINQTELKMLGYSARELLGQFIWKVSDDEAMSRRVVLAKLRGEMPPSQSFERMFRRKDGSTFPVWISDRILKRADGVIAGLHGSVQDITERKQVTQRVADALNFNQTVLRASPVGIVVFKATGPCISANEAIEQIIGGAREEVLKQNFRQLESWKSSGMLAAAEAALAAQEERRLETKMLTTFGRKVWCYCRFVPFQYEGELHLLLIISDITERKRAETELRESEARFRRLSDATFEAVVIHKSGVLLSANDQYFEMFGYTPDELLGKQALPLTVAPEAIEHLMKQVESGSIEPYESIGLRKDGTRFPMEIRVREAEHEGQRIRVGAIRDVTERKRAEEALQASAVRFRMLIERAPVAISISRGGRTIYVNQKYLDLYGFQNVDELVGQPVTDQWAPEFREMVMERAQQRARGEPVPSEYEGIGLRKDGSQFPMHISVALVELPDGPASMAFLTNITERKLAEERIREQATLLDSANDAIYVRKLDHTITYWNDGAERLYGWQRTEVMGHKVHEMIKYDKDAFETAQTALLAQGSWSGELNIASKTGKNLIAFCRWTVLRDEQGQPKEILAINTDITETKQLEANFLRAQRLEGIGALAGGIAHDLNNILQPILMAAPLLDEMTTDPENREMLNTVSACAKRGSDIIKQLLTFARGEPGARVPLPLCHLLTEMERLIHETFPRNIQLRVNVPKDLWLVMGDATQIHQAIMNLCVNARDAMPAGGTLTLTAENLNIDESFAAMMPSAKPGAYVGVSVTDTGTGITPGHLERIFEPFFTTKEIGKGTGLGLSTALGIVRGHGGFMRVNSHVGKGTTFEFYLPASPETKTAATSDRETLPPRARGELIIVVDDEPGVRGVVQRTLEKHGYKVVTAAEGAEALTLFAKHQAEVRAVLTDMMMPGMDGVALVHSLRRLDPQLPILGMTGMGERADIKNLESCDLKVLITKPFSKNVLISVLHDALASPRKAKDTSAN
jgi:PAS domain S-box-containing protein